MALVLRQALHEGLQALADVALSQRQGSVGFLTPQGSLVLLAAHQAQHSSVQVLELLLRGASTANDSTRVVQVAWLC